MPPSITLFTHHSRTSKAFHTQQTMKQSGCESCYTEALQVFLTALNTPYQHQVLHSAVRQYLHRMIVCLEQSILPYVPIAVEHLLKKCDARDLHEFLPLINQIVAKFKVRGNFECDILVSRCEYSTRWLCGLNRAKFSLKRHTTLPFYKRLKIKRLVPLYCCWSAKPQSYRSWLVGLSVAADHAMFRL